MIYDHIILTIHDKTFPAIGCGYYYTIQANGMAHTAFATTKGLKQWLSERSLKIGASYGVTQPRNRLPHTPFTKSFKIIGKYDRCTWMVDNKEFFQKLSHFTPTTTIDNGDMVIAFIRPKSDHDEYATIYLQNPNTDRFRLQYEEYNERARQYGPIRVLCNNGLDDLLNHKK